MKVRPQVKERIIGSVWAAAWMWPLISPAIAIAEGRTPHAVWAGIGLAAFVGTYIVVVTNGFDVDRRRGRVLPTGRDLLLLGIMTAIGITLFATYADAPDDWPGLLLYIGVAGAATFRPAIAGAWTVSVVMVTVSWAIGDRHAPSGGSAAQLVLGMLMAGALVQVVKQMQRYNQMLRNTRAELARNAVGQERLRFARDLHDLLGHTMSLIVVKAEVVRRLVEQDPDLAREAAADIEAIGRRALGEVRETVDGYRAPDFTTSLDNIRSALADAGIAVRVRQDGPAVPLGVSQLFGWVVREAATNVIRHSDATSTDIAVSVTATEAVLEIRDNGHGRRPVARTIGTPPDATGRRGGAGLVGLAERVAAAGGTLTADNARRGGFRVVARVPRRPAPDATPDRVAAGAAPDEAVPDQAVPDQAAPDHATSAGSAPDASTPPVGQPSESTTLVRSTLGSPVVDGGDA